MIREEAPTRWPRPGNDNERPGDRQRRGGKAWDDSRTQVAREASEGPRGNDNDAPATASAVAARRGTTATRRWRVKPPKARAAM